MARCGADRVRRRLVSPVHRAGTNRYPTAVSPDRPDGPDALPGLPDDLPPDVAAALGRMSRWREIGSGGFATVYVAYDETLQRDVAIKVLRAPLDALGRRRFERESRLIAKFSNHPHVLPLYDADVTDEDRGWLVMELATEGSLLDQVEAQGPLPPAAVAAIVTDLGSALDAAHEQGVVHCDVKPANVVRNDYGVVKLSDFGIAQPMLADQRSTLDAGVGPRSPAYASPELLLNEEVTRATDEWMLAATACHLLTGVPPFHGEQVDSAASAVERAVVRLRVRGLTSSALHAVLDKAFAEDPADRYPSCGALAAALTSVLEGSGTAMLTLDPEAPDTSDDTDAPDAPDAGGAHAGPGAAADPTAPARRSPLTRTRRRRRLAAAAAVVVALALGAGTLHLAGVGRSPGGNTDGATSAGPAGPVWIGSRDAAVRLTSPDGPEDTRVALNARGLRLLSPTSSYGGGGGVVVESGAPPLATRLTPSGPPVRVPLSGLPAGYVAEVAATTPDRSAAWLIARRDPADVQDARFVFVDFDRELAQVSSGLPDGVEIDPLGVAGAARSDGRLLLTVDDSDSAQTVLMTIDTAGDAVVTQLEEADRWVTGIVAAGDAAWAIGFGSSRVAPLTWDGDVPVVGDPVRLPEFDDLAAAPTYVGLDDGSLTVLQVPEFPTGEDAAGGGDGSFWVARRSGTATHQIVDPAVIGEGLGVHATSGSVVWWVDTAPWAVVRYDADTGDLDRVPLPDEGPGSEYPQFADAQIAPAGDGVLVTLGGQIFLVRQGETVQPVGVLSGARYQVAADREAAPDDAGITVVDNDRQSMLAIDGEGTVVDRRRFDGPCDDLRVRAETTVCLTPFGEVRVVAPDGLAYTQDVDVAGGIGIGGDYRVAGDALDQALYLFRGADNDKVIVPLDDASFTYYASYFPIGDDIYWPSATAEEQDGLPVGFSRYRIGDESLRTVEAGEQVTDFERVAGLIWGATSTGVVRINADTAAIEGAYPATTSGTTGSQLVAVGDKLVWVSSDLDRLALYDPTRPESPTVVPVTDVTSAAAVDEAVFLLEDDTIVRYDEDGNVAARVSADDASSVTATATALWVLFEDDDELRRLDPTTNAFDLTVDLD